MTISFDPPFANVIIKGCKEFSVKTYRTDEESVANSEYCIVLLDVSNVIGNRYGFLRIEDMTSHYGVYSQFGYGLEKIAETLYSENRKPLPNGMSVFMILEKGEPSNSFALSYMPNRRKPITKAEREAVYEMFDGHCAYCGCHIEYGEMQVDHVTSHYRNMGKDRLDNYFPSCADCNGLKSDYSIEEFRYLVSECGAIAQFKRNGRPYRIARKYGLLMRPNKKIVFRFEKENA